MKRFACVPRLFAMGLPMLAVRAASTLAQPDPADRIVQLPPLIVTESRTTEARAWRYAEAPGFEILSRCSDGATADFARGFHRATWLLQALVPPQLVVKMSAPAAVLLYASESAQQLPPELVAQMRRGENGGGDAGPVRLDVLPNLSLRDHDFTATYSLIDERTFDGYRMRLTPENLRERLEQRTPPLPRWFVEGVLTLYRSGDFRYSDVLLPPIVWVTPEETKALRADRDHPRSLLSLAELFRERTAAEAAAPDTLATPWRIQSALFIRWTLEGKKKSRREALWRFVARAAEQPVTEEMFQECFGLDYADAQDRLSDYLPTAVRGDLTLAPPVSLLTLKLALRPATTAEIARIKGDWERLSIAYVRERYPMLMDQYATQARRTLMGAYDRGERDPRLLAVIGLNACDARHDTEARSYLEAAVLAGVNRPRACFELARLRYLDLVSHLRSPETHFSASQVDDLLQPLRLARDQSPPEPAAYDLLMHVLAQAERNLSPDEVAWITEGAHLFPRSNLIVFQAAKLLAFAGARAEAEAVISRTLALPLDDAARKAFEQILPSLAPHN
jgi:hypothetical protein